MAIGGNPRCGEEKENSWEDILDFAIHAHMANRGQFGLGK
jgi:hypothetical protein